MRVRLRPGEAKRAVHYLELLSEPGATISIGTNVGAWLHEQGFVTIARWGRYGITPKGIDALRGNFKLGEPNGTRGNSKRLPGPEKQGLLFDFERG